MSNKMKIDWHQECLKNWKYSIVFIIGMAVEFMLDKKLESKLKIKKENDKWYEDNISGIVEFERKFPEIKDL